MGAPQISRHQFLFSGFYSSQFILLGVQLPFLSAWLATRDFSAPEIGWITGAALAARLALGPFVAYWADRQADQRRAIRLVSALFAAGAAGLWVADEKILIGVCVALVHWAFGLLVPLSDSATLQADRADQLNYGQTRAVGSLAFLMTTIIGGYFLSRYGINLSVKIMAAAGAATLVLSMFLPPRPVAMDGVSSNWRDAPRLLRSKNFLLMVAAAGLVQGAHAVYYAFSILRWSEIGYSPTLVGALWAVAVMAEILLLTRARRFAARLSPALMIALGGLGAAVRWSLTAMEPPVYILFAVQLLHALTFAAAYLGAIEFIDRAVPRKLVNTAMTLTSTTGVGAITGGATIAAGYVFHGEGAAAAYFMMAAMGALAFVLSMALARLWRGGRIV